MFADRREAREGVVLAVGGGIYISELLFLLLLLILLFLFRGRL